MKTVSRYVLAVLMIAAGTAHFAVPAFYTPLVPPYLPAHRELVRLSGVEPDLASALWLLTHPDLRHAPRVRAFMDHMAEEIAALRALFAGAPPT